MKLIIIGLNQTYPTLNSIIESEKTESNFKYMID